MDQSILLALKPRNTPSSSPTLSTKIGGQYCLNPEEEAKIQMWAALLGQADMINTINDQPLILVSQSSIGAVAKVFCYPLSSKSNTTCRLDNERVQNQH